MDYEAFDRVMENERCRCLCDEPMSAHTTFRIGGPADRLVTVETQEQLSAVLRCVRSEDIPCLILGRGSNLLVSDKGIRGVVLQLGGAFKDITLPEDGCSISAGAAVSLRSLCDFACEHGLSGLEFAFGIPGSVGGAVYMDAGAYGGEMRDVVRCVTHMTPEGELVTLPNEALGFDYRKSRYTGGQDVIVAVEYELRPGEPAAIREKMAELLNRRREKQPYDMPSAGSVFKRPKVGYAAAMIEECGLKGRRVGGAQVSEKHSGFIVNLGGATCGDVLELIEIVQREVFQQTGTKLEREVRVIGER